MEEIDKDYAEMATMHNNNKINKLLYSSCKSRGKNFERKMATMQKW